MSEAAKEFWADESKRVKTVWPVIAGVAMLATVIGVLSDRSNVMAANQHMALLLRAGMCMYFLATLLYVFVRKQVSVRGYHTIKFFAFLAISLPVTAIGMLAEQNAELYMLGMVEAEVVLATFAPLPTPIFLPLVLAVNLIHLASVHMLNLPSDVATNVAVTLMVFLALVVIANRAIVGSSIREIAQRHKTEKEYERAQGILDSINDAFFLLDSNWQFTYFNPASERLMRAMDQGQQEMLGRNIWDIFPNLVGHSLMHKEFSHAIAANEVVHFDEYYPLLRAHLAISAYPSAGGLSVYATDITARKLSDERKRLKELASRAEKVREEEKSRISRDIHDDLGQLLTVLGMDLAWLERRGGHTDPETRERIETMTSLVGDSIQAVKRITADLHPGVLSQRGLTEALRWFAGQIVHRTGIRGHVCIEKELDLPTEKSALVFRIVQEAVTNVVRHAEARDIWLNLEVVDNEVIVTVEDNGTGITPEALARSDKSMGLRSMQERAQALEGSLRLDRTREGTVVTLTFPLPPATEKGKLS